MKILLDTNILVYAYNKSSPNQKVAASIIKKSIQGELEAYITSQVLYEMFAVITNPKRVEKPLPIEDAAELCIKLWECNEIKKINPSRVTPIEVFKLAKSLKLCKAKVFDCCLAVAAKENGIDTIYTENVDDFKGYLFVKTWNPFEE
ncbi:MAG: type II toxin-antitoxin system VapC family toxin [Candidatus Bathyarchaeota archaeon]|nr:type II toxin-antitoxin system VapC family toxin [Candidatus Termiticorpusculum sp.]